MSALLENFEVRDLRWGGQLGERLARPTLRRVVAAPARASRMVFVIVLLTLLGAGMVGVLVLNTTIQERSLKLSAAQRTADDLGYQQASLTAQLDQKRSSTDLAARAWDMGMRPDANPVFVQLGADGKPGKVVGTGTPVTGSEMPDQKYSSADDVTRAIQAAQAQVEQQKKAAEAAAVARAAAAKQAAAQAAAAKASAAASASASPSAAASTSASPSARPSATTTTGTGKH